MRKIQACTLCAPHLPHGPRPVLQLSPSARILIAGQAPGRRVHETGIPFNDPSGERLREWLGLDRGVFYDPAQIAILPMGFCFPGSGKTGDLPPRSECAPAWRQQIMDHLQSVTLTVLIGQYAIAWHLGSMGGKTLTDTVSSWKQHQPRVWPLPHPSPRNNIWLKKNPWFETDVLPELRRKVSAALA